MRLAISTTETLTDLTKDLVVANSNKNNTMMSKLINYDSKTVCHLLILSVFCSKVPVGISHAVLVCLAACSVVQYVSCRPTT